MDVSIMDWREGVLPPAQRNSAGRIQKCLHCGENAPNRRIALFTNWRLARRAQKWVPVLRERGEYRRTRVRIMD
jgi:hypothetical protein